MQEMSLPFFEALLGNFYLPIMDNKDKKENEQLQSTFLVPFSPNTPRIQRNYNSTVFFTPPDSYEGPARLAPCLASHTDKIPFDLSIGLEEFTERLDILKRLDESSMVTTVCSLIFEYLDEFSLHR